MSIPYNEQLALARRFDAVVDSGSPLTAQQHPALAHAAIGTSGMEAEKKDQADQAQLEITNARAVQAQTGCSWTEALKQARHPFLEPRRLDE